jgi:hypothetical protein
MAPSRRKPEKRHCTQIWQNQKPNIARGSIESLRKSPPYPSPKSSISVTPGGSPVKFNSLQPSKPSSPGRLEFFVRPLPLVWQTPADWQIPLHGLPSYHTIDIQDQDTAINLDQPQINEVIPSDNSPEEIATVPTTPDCVQNPRVSDIEEVRNYDSDSDSEFNAGESPHASPRAGSPLADNLRTNSRITGANETSNTLAEIIQASEISVDEIGTNNLGEDCTIANNTHAGFSRADRSREESWWPIREYINPMLPNSAKDRRMRAFRRIVAKQSEYYCLSLNTVD